MQDDRISAYSPSATGSTAVSSGNSSGCFTVTPLLPRPPPPPVFVAASSSAASAGSSTYQRFSRPWSTSSANATSTSDSVRRGGTRNGGRPFSTNTLPLPTNTVRYLSSLSSAAPDDGVIGGTGSPPFCSTPTTTVASASTMVSTLPSSFLHSTAVRGSGCSNFSPSTTFNISPHSGHNGRLESLSGTSPTAGFPTVVEEAEYDGVALSLVHPSSNSVAMTRRRSKKDRVSPPSLLSANTDGCGHLRDVIEKPETQRFSCCCCGSGNGNKFASVSEHDKIVTGKKHRHHQHQQRRKCCIRNLTTFFLVGVPLFGIVGASLAWFYASRQILAVIEYDNDMIRRQTLQLGRLIIDFSTERELTAIYVTARSTDSQIAAKTELDAARQRVDQTLTSLVTWPASDHPDLSAPTMFRSPHLFAAVLGGHRAAVRVGVYFWDEVQFYADLIDVIIGWLDRDVVQHTKARTGSTTAGSVGSDLLAVGGAGATGSGRLSGLLQAYGYLMAAIGYIGAEQALCSVFHSVVCFSHRETFYYANYSFAGESLFRLYRHSYPPQYQQQPTSNTFNFQRPTESSQLQQQQQQAQTAALGSSATPQLPPPRSAGWRSADHRTFFPELTACRRDIVADLDYIGSSTDPSLCAPSRQNETRFVEVELLTVDEMDRLTDEIYHELEFDERAAARRKTISCLVAASVASYAAVALLVRCATIGRTDRCCACSSTASSSSADADACPDARRRKRKLLTSPMPSGNSWCPVSTNSLTTAAACETATGTTDLGDDHFVSRHLAASDGNYGFVDVVENNHKNSLSSPTPPSFSVAANTTVTLPNSFPALKVACV